MRRLIAVLLIAAAWPVATAAASPVATDDGSYGVLGRVFPDPMGGCQQMGSSPCSPNAQGNLPAGQFIGYQEFVDGMKYMNSKPEWARYMEVWPLDGKEGDNDANPAPASTPAGAFPGNNLGSFEFQPKAEYHSVGLAQTDGSRSKQDLWVVRVTDETVPDAGKKRVAYSLSIHGIERAGAEGGTRAIEDLVTAFTTKRDGQKIVPDGTIPNAPTFADVLRKTIIYFVYPNPDGWRRGSVSQGGVFFQRYNGNGVDLNRDWPDVGFAFRPYSPLSEPETRAFSTFFKEVASSGPAFGTAADLHGQLTADALSYTLLGHGRKDWAKDTRVREMAKAIHKVSEKALAWSPLIVPNSTPKSQNGCVNAAGQAEACAHIYGQTWGTVYDTINYTTTGALGDWMDSPYGLNTDGIDNEMSFSHLDRNIVFDPQGEQLHVDGNKALIYAQLTQLLNPPATAFDAPGRKGYVASPRLKHGEETFNPAPPPGTKAQPDITGQSGTPSQDGVTFPFEVKEGNGIFNGGLRVDITKLNAQGISDGNAVTQLLVQCRFCDDHPGVDPSADGWVTVAEDFNQSPAYAQAGLTASVNRPLAVNREGKKVEWRAVLASTPPNFVDAGATMDVRFTQGPATVSGDTSGAPAPKLGAYDVANTDVFKDLNANIAAPADRFEAVNPDSGDSLDGISTLVVADRADLPDAFWNKVRAWVQGGGTLILTDSALRNLPKLVDVDARDIKSRTLYVGQVSFALKDGQDSADDVKDPLLTTPVTVKQDGARFNSSIRRQTFEPTPLGYSIQYTDPKEGTVGNDHATSPAWDVDRAAFEKAGGRTVATAVEGGDTGAASVQDRAAMGEAKVGAGKVRFLGALLPQPTEKYAHDFGIEPYALTYTGHILLRNMLEVPRAPDGTPSFGSPVKLRPGACAVRNGFRSVSARARGRGLNVAFARILRERVNVDVFQTSRGRKVLRERLVARYRDRTRNFVWNGKATVKGRKVTDGFYFVRYSMRLADGSGDTRRITLRRAHGRFTRRPAHYRRESCGLLASYKLTRPAFSGAGVGIAYRMSHTARTRLTVLRGKKVVKSYRTGNVKPGTTVRTRFRAGRRGDYRFVLTVTPTRGRPVRGTLTSRRL